VSNVVLRGNVFINYTDPSNPLNAPMQGIGCFDGQFVNWRVENNIVITNHWHGISFYGMHDSFIINNTVVDINDSTPGPSWIKTAAYGGIDSNNVVVRNNLANSFSLAGQNIISDHNAEVDASNFNQLFINPPYNLQLKINSFAIDTGDASVAPIIDIIGTTRPYGIAHDLGAYEYRGDVIFNNGFD